MPEAAAGKNMPERRLCATEEFKEEPPEGRLLYLHDCIIQTIGAKAVKPACVVVDPSPCCLKTVLNCPACPMSAM